MSRTQDRKGQSRDSEVRVVPERQELMALWAADLVADKEVWGPLREELVLRMEEAGKELEQAVEGYKLYRAQGCKVALIELHNYIVGMAKIGNERRQQDLEGKEMNR